LNNAGFHHLIILSTGERTDLSANHSIDLQICSNLTLIIDLHHISMPKGTPEIIANCIFLPFDWGMQHAATPD
jgi:hypothetical protein